MIRAREASERRREEKARVPSKQLPEVQLTRHDEVAETQEC